MNILKYQLQTGTKRTDGRIVELSRTTTLQLLGRLHTYSWFCSGPNQLASWQTLCVSSLAWFDFTLKKCPANQSLSTKSHVRAGGHSLVTNQVVFAGGEGEFVLVQDNVTLLRDGAAEVASPHSYSSHLGQIWSRGIQEKWHLRKDFKTTSCEQCVASHHAEKTPTVLQVYSNNVQGRIEVGSHPDHHWSRVGW